MITDWLSLNSPKKKNKLKTNKKLFVRGNFTPFISKKIQMWDNFFPLLFFMDSEALKIVDIQLREVGAKRRLSGTSQVNGQTTDKQTDTQTDILTYRKHLPKNPIIWRRKKMLHVTWDTWHVTCDMWRVTGDMWQVTHDI